MAHRNSPAISGAKNLLGGQLRAFREEAGVTQKQFAEKLQVAGWDAGADVVNRIEQGSRSLTDVEMLFLLDVLGRKIIDLKEPKNRPKPIKS